MPQIKIVTDSTADLPAELVKKNNITVVPLKVNIKENTYKEGVDLTPEQFYDILKDCEDDLPTTSQPSPGEFAEIYEDLAEQGADLIISIHLSSKLSGTYQSALLAKSMVEDKVKVEVIDSQLVSMGLGLLVLAASNAVEDKKDFSEIISMIEVLKEKIKSLFLVDTLKYLQKGGRIGKASSLLGTLLNIKPILAIIDGEVNPYHKVRGMGKALDFLVDTLAQDVKSNDEIVCAITHSNALESANKLKEKLYERFKCQDIIVSDIGAVVGTHVGPGTVALLFYTK